MGDIQFNGTQEEWDALVKKNKSKSVTAVDWLIENLMINGLIRLTKEQHGLYKELTGLAKQMEKGQIEISDEEIENEAERYEKVDGINSFKEAIKWYREQLKNK